MKICTIVGARPQFIKAAALSRILRTEHKEVLIHTGQHYDYNMSEIFFKELSIPHPDYNLGIAGGTHGQMTGQMLPAIESVLVQENPDMVLVYGDTNSTLAGALAAVKLHIPVCHIEAGVRMGTLINPEEVNRVLTDRISRLLMCCTATATLNLKKEGIAGGVYNVGDLMYDALLYYGGRLVPPNENELIDLKSSFHALPKRYYLLTCHREENTGTDLPLLEIFSALEQLDAPALYPVHPRNQERAKRLVQEKGFQNILLIQPVGYLTSLYLIKHAEKIVTDSGGLQREAWFYAKQCLTLLDHPVWPETFEGHINQMCNPITSEILQKLAVTPDFSKRHNQFGDGHAAEKITQILSEYDKFNL